MKPKERLDASPIRRRSSASYRLRPADRPLDIERARVAIAARFPAVDAHDLKHLGSGWEFDAYVTGDDWVFRFPRQSEHAGRFAREVRIHDLVRPLLLPRFAVPSIELASRSGPRFPYPIAGHRLLPGVGADSTAAPSSKALASDVGAALSAVHSVSEAEALAAGAAPDDECCPDWYEEAREAATSLRDIDPVVDRALEWLASVDTVPGRYSGPRRFVHGDLCPDHLLLDPATGRLTGILDWTDAATDDPAVDFTVLALWRGWDFIEEVARNYRPPRDASFMQRLGFMARVRALLWLHESRGRATDVAKHIRWVARAFAAPDRRPCAAASRSSTRGHDPDFDA